MTKSIHKRKIESFIESFNHRYPPCILKTLLCDRTTGKNIIWADNEYESLGSGYMMDDEITVDKITDINSTVIKPRIVKEQEKQSQRTKSRAEVFTPSWLCNQMNNDLDETWFGSRNIFNTEKTAENGVETWSATEEPVTFPDSKVHSWQAYIEAPILEITCGEAPFICSRYDTVTGNELPLRERVGFLDRKLRIVTEQTRTHKEWVFYALNALRATYGFEYQGDNLLIARINVFETFVEHFCNNWKSSPTREELEQAARIVSWNLWQMNGLTDCVPTNSMNTTVQSTLTTPEKLKPEPIQLSLFDLFEEPTLDKPTEEAPQETVPLCVIYNWRRDKPIDFASLKDKVTGMKKQFYAIIGNPPYQESRETTKDMPIYNDFMDAAYKVADKVELITPARFLFNAGATPKSWNLKMLNDKHFKVMSYESSSKKIFANTDIKGGVAITYRDEERDFGSIGVFTPFEELNSIYHKISRFENFISLNTIMYPYSTYTLSDKLHRDYPNLLKDKILSNSKIITTNIFDLLDELFYETKSNDDKEYCCIVGRKDNKRSSMYIEKKYINVAENYNKYKVLIPVANGSGSLGEKLSTPLVGHPLVGYTQSFLGIGSLDTLEEAEALMKYIKGKFARCLLGVLKITQHNPPEKWKYVPLQDFTKNSDLDWSKSISEIDQQLYKKYNLSEEEISFIESHVKEMD